MLVTAVARGFLVDGLSALGRAREEIDALNVFPVPDGDTGTNLYLTVEAALEALDELPAGTEMASALRTVARGALLGARGNSGVILSQFARGVVEAIVAAAAAGSRVSEVELLCAALRGAADAGYVAVSAPVEGTILTVMCAAAEGAEAACAAGALDLVAAARAAASAARSALARTPDLLPALRDAGVVDAGGRGLTVLLDTLVRSVSGARPASEPARLPLPRPSLADRVSAAGGPPFEVMYLLEAPSVDALRTELAALGDSLLVVGGDGLWNVHVHVHDVGAAIEAGIRAGRPYRITVAHFAEQVARQQVGRSSASRVVVVIAPSDGLADLARSAGALVVAGQRPSTREVLDVIQAAHAAEVVVLPNDRETTPVADAAAEYARAAGLRVAVVPSRASVQVLAALAVHDAGRRFDDDVVAMAAAARATRSGSVTTAVSRALTSAGVCEPGDVLGILDEDVVLIRADVLAASLDLLDRMLTAGGELVTLVVGAGAPPNLADALIGHLRRSHPEVEVGCFDGGPQAYPLLAGVE